MEKLVSTLTLPECLNRTFTCDCGREHHADLDAAIVGKDAMKQLPGWLKSKGYEKIYLVCDNITLDIAGKTVENLLLEAGLDADLHVITHLGFDEATLGELLINLKPDRQAVVAVGTGTINDMCRYFAFKVDLPYCIVATAAPMDGFASSISALFVNNLKTTFDARTPALIVGDTEVLKNAPYRMISAGLGDLIGKFTCLCDWKLAKLLNDEYYCTTIVDMVDNCAHNVLDNAGQVKSRDPEVIGSIMEGLVFTGVAMSMVGNSRPASGCEHHISHYWEMIFEQNGKRPVPHGHQVGVGTVLILKLVEALRKREKVDFDRARAAAKAYDQSKWEEEIRAAYGPAAQGVIDMEIKAKKNETTDRLRRIDRMEQHWDEVTALLDALPSSETVMDLMKELDAPYLPNQIDVDSKLLKNTLMYCKEVRARYTILQVLWDLDLLDELSDEIVAYVEAN